MKKTLLTAALTAACISLPAQASNFEGLSIGVGATSADTTTEYVHGGSTSSTNTDSNLVFQLQYNMAFNDMFLMGFGGTAGAGDLKAGTIGTTDLKVKDAYSLYVAPSLAFNRN